MNPEPRLTDRHPWLVQPDGTIGVACLNPDCARIVERQPAGRQAKFCGRSHRDDYRRRRTALVDDIANIEQRLATAGSRALNRRQTEAELTYLRAVLIGYPDPHDT